MSRTNTKGLPPPVLAVCSTARVLYPFTAIHDDEISVCYNDIVKIQGYNTQPEVAGWCIVSFRGETGKLPSAILEVILNPFIGIDITTEFSFKAPNVGGQFISFEKGTNIQLVDRSPDGWDVALCNEHLGLYPSVISNIPATPEAFKELEQIIMKSYDDDFVYVRSLFKVLDKEENNAVMIDGVLWPFIQLFLHHDKFFVFMESIIKKEVEECPEESVLFRKNSLASKLFSRYTLATADSYLKETIGPLVKYIAEYGHSFEVDPQRIEDLEELEQNQNALLDASLNILQRLLESVDKIEPGLRFCFYIIQRNVATRFPDSFHKSIGGFYFLRMICPIIAACDVNRLGLGILNFYVKHIDKKLTETMKIENIEISSSARRGMILITKILQTIANEVQFGSKEYFMVPLNGDIEQQRNLCKEILTKIPLQFDAAIWKPVHISDEELTEILTVIHSWVSKESFTNQLWKKVNQTLLTKEELFHFRKTILRCGTPLPIIIPELKLSPRQELLADIKQRNKTGIQPSKSSKNRIKKDRREKKRKEEKEKEKEKEIQIPTGKLQCGSYLKGKHSTAQKTKLRYYALYQGSNNIYMYASFDDAPHNISAAINLEPCFSVKQQKVKNYWEFKVLTIHEEHVFVTTEEEIFRKWLVILDKRLNESVMSDADKHEKQVMITSLEEKLAKCYKDLTETKQRLKQSYDNPSAEDSKHLEELMVAIQNLQNSLQLLNG